MIEFNEKAKEDHPVASVLDTDVYILFKEIKLAGACTVDPLLSKDIIACCNDNNWTTVLGKLVELGWEEAYSEDLPTDVVILEKKGTSLHLAWTSSGWHKLNSWASLINYGDPPKEKAAIVASYLYKIAVLGFGFTKKNGLPKWTLPQGHPAAELMEDV
jgi:hypothetical protein